MICDALKRNVEIYFLFFVSRLKMKLGFGMKFQYAIVIFYLIAHKCKIIGTLNRRVMYLETNLSVIVNLVIQIEKLSH